MDMITSPDNGKIKNVCRLVAKKKERYASGLFVAEGEKQVLEAPADMIESVFCTETFFDAHKSELPAGKTELVTERVFGKMSDTQTPQGVLAVMKMNTFTPEAISTGETQPPLIILLEDVRDPGNLGTIVRSAEAAGATGIIMSGGCADIYSPKTVRSAMGSVYRVPFCYADDFCSEIERLKQKKIAVYAAYLKSSIPYFEADMRGGSAILIGNEAAGLKAETAGLADKCIVIPMAGSIESLNAAMAASVIIFEAARQRQM